MRCPRLRKFDFVAYERPTNCLVKTIEPKRWDQLKSILDEMLAQPQIAGREAVLRTRCGDDAGLLREAESLLAEADLLGAEPTDWMEQCADQATRTYWDEDLSRDGQRIGAYVVLRQLGRGGMGAVYLAARADGQFEKEVAIKILKRGTDTEEVLERFSAERHILARLDHPNIARLLDAGTTEDGLPYFVMEYIAGVAVDRFVFAQQLSVEERLAIFLKICAAVEVAHHHQVIHRDLKPSNILVNAAGEPKLLDFGIAKLLGPREDGRDLTVTRGRRLTPSAASPEQARGEAVTARSDIYALGTLLYRMLTGKDPHRFSSSSPAEEELERVICEEEPPAPSASAEEVETKRRLRGDLDKVVLYAMRKEASARYSSVTAFAEDIRAHLGGFAVQARPQSLAYRLQRSVFRNRRVWQNAALTAALVILAVVFLVWRQPKTSPVVGSVPAPASTFPAQKSIGVLPFENLSESSDHARFATGVQDQILSRLAKVSDLTVISRSSLASYTGGMPRDLDAIGEQLGVRYAVEGSVQGMENRVRVTVRLTEIPSKTQVWGESFDREMTDIFAIQSEIARAIVAQLQVRLLPSEKVDLETALTADLTAYDHYLEAKQLVDAYLEAPDPSVTLQKALLLLEAAVERDPNFALAHAYMGRAHTLMAALGIDRSKERIALATEAIRTALRLKPSSGEVHLVQAEFLWRVRGSGEEILRELAIAERAIPNHPFVYGLRARVHRDQGRWEKAAADFGKALQLDPRNTNAARMLADTFVMMRRYQEATAVYKRAMVRGVAFVNAGVVLAGIEFAETGDAAGYRAALAALPAEMDVAGGDTPPRILMELIEKDYEGAKRVLAASPRNDFQEMDFTFYYPRAWYEAMIARAEADEEKMRQSFEAAQKILLAREQERPFIRTQIALAQVLAGLGRKVDGISLARRVVQSVPPERNAYNGSLVLQGLAQVYTWTGEKELALETLERLISIPGYLSYGYLLHDPAWNPLRGEDRFEALLAALAPPSSKR